MTERMRRWPLGVVVVALLAGPAAAQPVRDDIVPHRATYELFRGDKRVGESVFALSYDSATERYTFESQSRFRGLLRFAAPRPVIERSEFVVTDGMLRPIAFVYEDGSRRGEDNVSLAFDWSSRTLTVERQDDVSAGQLMPGTLDRGSLRVALMRDLAHDALAGSYALADPDVVRSYATVLEATEEIETALGTVTALRIRQQRDGSSRHTLLWMAPSLNYVILRLEQIREDRDPVAFVIEDVEWARERDDTGRED